MNRPTPPDYYLNLLIEFLKYNALKGTLTWLKRPSPSSAAGDQAKHIDAQGYVVVRFRGRTNKGHRIAWFLHYGKWPSENLDHINGNRADNRIDNLREASIRTNGRNRIEHRNGKLPGAFYDKTKRRWTSQIQINGKIKWLGAHKTEELAHHAYLEALKNIGE